MRDKRTIALFISSIVALVASISISVGMAVAFADPVIATNLPVLSYKVTANQVREMNLDPVSAFNENVEEYVLVNSYDEVLYANEAVVNDIRLAKMTVENDYTTDAVFRVTVLVEGTTNAVNHVKIAIFDLQTREVYRFKGNQTSVDISLENNKTGRYILAAYVKTAFETEEVVFPETYMRLTISTEQVNV
ncbi:MAG: hypothetical protein IJ542_02960 [Clostridia bacterium]|nr:hypothetical protein [Clostridia bacterium]